MTAVADEVSVVLGQVVPVEVAALYAAAFDIPRDPRSLAYKRGVLAVFRLRVEGIRIEGGPYRRGTAEADAFHSGTDEGHRRWREHESRALATANGLRS